MQLLNFSVLKTFGIHATVTKSAKFVLRSQTDKSGEMSEPFDENLKDCEMTLEESPEVSSSNFSSIDVTTHTSSSAMLNWSYIRPATIESSQEVVFKLLQLESRDEWRSIAWTRRTTCKIENLEQNVCYSLQLLVLLEDEAEFRVVDKSKIFKVKQLN